ncbi:MAG: PAC2 family protein, partial [Candidatus Freyarchaeota archaeon]|nr:PAC2 family protein [Candidatus Jordarchaeia archaeon]
MTSRGIYTISHHIAQFMSKNGVKLIVTLGAYIVESSATKNSSNKVYIATTHKENEHLKKLLNLPNAKPMTEGEILGANGIVPTLAKQEFGIEGAIILSETSAQLASMGNSDPQAVKTLVETLTKYLNLPLDGSNGDNQKPSKNQADEKPPKREYQEEELKSYIC